jgi:hypothetical protein
LACGFCGAECGELRGKRGNLCGFCVVNFVVEKWDSFAGNIFWVGLAGRMHNPGVRRFCRFVWSAG